MFELNPLIGVSYEFIFQIFNTIVILGIFIFIIYSLYKFFKKNTYKK